MARIKFKMDPVEAGEWIAGRPLQLVFLTGLDPSNKLHHKDIVDGFLKNSEEKPPLHVNVIFGELDIPSKSESKIERGILRREWPLKYLSKVPALIVVFVDLDWNHSSWEEKKTEAESKINSVRAQTRHGTKLALVMIQKSKTCANDSQAADRAHEISQACSLSSKQLFVLPTDGDLETYISKLGNSFHELCQSFYQQRLKHIRSRNIPNNSPALFVRQQFKLAFISELRQDTHTALRNYRLAYDQCRDTAEQWDAVDIFEWRSVVGLLNYKMCELCFLHSTALEAINQMRKHTSIFFSSAVGIYPTPQLASIEFLLWKAKEHYHFAQLFERAVSGGLCAIATLNPGTHLDQAASMYAVANVEISTLKKAIPANVSYPSPDPLEHAPSTVFFGQRPWRIGCDGLASATVEAAAVNAISQRLVINYEGVISLLTAAMSQYKKYGCVRMQRKVMMEMANTCYANNEIPKALQLWSLVTRDNSLPYSVRKDMMHRAAWASYATASVQDFAACCLQLMSPAYSSVLPNKCDIAFEEVLGGNVPCSLFPDDDVSQEQLESYQQQWKHAISDGLDFTLQASRIDYFLDAKVSFIEDEMVDKNRRVNVKVELTSKIDTIFRAKDVIVFIEAKENGTDQKKQVLADKKHLGSVKISKQNAVKKFIQFSFRDVKDEMMFRVVKLVIELGSAQVTGRIEYDEGVLNRHTCEKHFVGNGTVKLRSPSDSIQLESKKVVDCLIGEIIPTELMLRNVSKLNCANLRLNFNRNKQKFTEAAAVLFVDQEETELKPEYSLTVCNALNANETVRVPLMLSAQLVGEYSIQLELSYGEAENSQAHETTVLEVDIVAKEPFAVNSYVTNMNGIPMKSILNNCDHVLNVDIQSAASINITDVEFLVADVARIPGRSGKVFNDYIYEGEVFCYSTPISVLVEEEEPDTPLGRLSIEWKRSGSVGCSVRSTFPLCRIPVMMCPITISSLIKNGPPIVRQPIEISFELKNRSDEVIEVTLNFDLNDIFMFCGERKVLLTVLPNNTRRITVVVMALTAGRLNFPKLSMKSSKIPENVIQQALRVLPATIFVLPRSKNIRQL